MVDLKTVSVILPAVNETNDLLKTVEIIERECQPDILEYIIVVCGKTTKECLAVCDEIKSRDEKRFLLHFQNLPFLGGAIREAFDIACGSHVIMMASDMETNPENVKDLIREARQKPEAIITTSRWTKEGEVEGYNAIKLILNYIFQKLFSLVYRVHLTDMTYGYRIFPTKLVQSINWEELKHPFLFETIVKPLRLGTKVVEIPTVWKARTEGESQNTFLTNFYYFNTGFRVLFYSKEKILKQN
ncbi:MAG: glycosyltransferase family 2 protein [Gammaproteobacteria bacterium]|nr:glycosyltransferase family 2 protein [Gammaproteobacteria bacterium]